MNKTARIDNLFGIRGILFLLIFGTHLKYVIADSHLGQTLFPWLNNGGFAVLFFFLLSGFGMTLGYSDFFSKVTIANCKEFLLKRLVKFYPLYLITGTIMFIFVKFPENFDYLYAYLFLYIPMLFPWTKYLDGGGNAAAWFLASLFWCYMLTPFMLLFLNKFKNIKTNLLCITVSYVLLVIIGGVLQMFHMENTNYYYKMPLIRIIQYFIAINLGMIYKNYLSSKMDTFLNKISLKNIFDIAFIVVIISLMFSPFAHSIFYRNLVCLPVISIFILYLCINGKSILYSILNNKTVHFISGICFECYLIHYVVMELMKPHCLNYIYTIKGITFLAVIFFVITIILSYTYKKLQNVVMSYFTSKNN